MTEKVGDVKFSEPLNVLIVEDNQVDLRITEAMLKDSSNAVASVRVARTLEETLKVLNENEIDVIVLDLNLPDSQGTETLQTLANQHGSVAVVVNTGAYEEELGIAALEYGAQDFLVKGRYNGYTLIKGLHYAFKRKQLEKDLIEANKNLADAHEKLVQAEKMKVVGGLASGVAHEVRNPLATIIYGVTYLKQQLRTDDNDIQTVVDSVDEAAHRASTIIKDLLDFANLGKLNQVPVKIQEILDRSIELLSHEFEGTKLTVHKEYDDGLGPINIDKNRIEQVCLNIVLNGAIAMNKTGTLTLKTESMKLTEDHEFWKYLNENHFKKDQEVAVISVIDEGSGVEEEHLKDIFDPFFTTRRARGGIGLGLSVCRNIMDLHKGAIFLKNNESVGASTYIVFPQ